MGLVYLIVEQRFFREDSGWTPEMLAAEKKDWQLVMVFGASYLLKRQALFEEIRSFYPQAIIFGCSTAGEILGSQVQDETVALTAVQFHKTSCLASQIKIDRVENSYQVGQSLVKAFPARDLLHLLVVCDGLGVNGSELVKGMSSCLPANVAITGGLAGDGLRYRETVVMCSSPGESHTVAALGFYGRQLKIRYGSRGGWDPFGPERLVNRARGNVLYEMDNHSALSLFKKYLGRQASGLPATGAHYPLYVRSKDNRMQVYRGIINISEADGSVIFGGDIPEGSYARLMKANIDRLVDGAISAAEISQIEASRPPGLAILISCLGRKIALRQRVEEELEGIQNVMGPIPMSGFYSYGEIAPNSFGGQPEFQNLTMTVTTFSEE